MLWTPSLWCPCGDPPFPIPILIKHWVIYIVHSFRCMCNLIYKVTNKRNSFYTFYWCWSVSLLPLLFFHDQSFFCLEIWKLSYAGLLDVMTFSDLPGLVFTEVSSWAERWGISEASSIWFNPFPSLSSCLEVGNCSYAGLLDVMTFSDLAWLSFPVASSSGSWGISFFAL